MKRQQLHERNQFDDEDRYLIYQKSNGRCAHCGKQIMFGGQATVDHFIPLRKGGTNQKCNLIMLCHDCNTQKSSKVVDPVNYLKYLRPEAYQALNDYFQSYIHSFEYISRGNLLCCDKYVLKIPLMSGATKHKNRRMPGAFKEGLMQYYTLERAYPDDTPRLEEFYIWYLKKYDHLVSEHTAKKAIEFWMRFGAVYFVENQQKEIRMMVPITVATQEGEQRHLDIHIFSRYKGNNASFLIREIPRFIGDRILEEQELPYLKTKTWILSGDNAGRFLPHSMFLANGITVSCICWNNHEYDISHSPKYVKNEADFYKSFPNINDSLDRFFKDDENKAIEYMKHFVINE